MTDQAGVDERPYRLCAECGAQHRGDDDNTLCGKFTPVNDEPRRRFVGKLPTVSREEIEEAEAAREAEWEVIPVVGESAPVGRALFLSEQEWDDLTVIMQHYRNQWSWADDPDDPRTQEFVGPIRRKLVLAERIIEANR